MSFAKLSDLKLEGNLLLEASAGTGKTYTITSLVLKAISGFFARTYRLDEILIVTFTNAATKEISHRIKKRLENAKNELLTNQIQDSAVQEIIQKINKNFFLTNLQNSLNYLNRLNVFTIHGFCQQIVKENFLLANFKKEKKLLTDLTQIENQAAFFVFKDLYNQDKNPTLNKFFYEFASSKENMLKKIKPFCDRDVFIKNLEKKSIHHLMSLYLEQTEQIKNHLIKNLKIIKENLSENIKRYTQSSLEKKDKNIALFFKNQNQIEILNYLGKEKILKSGIKKGKNFQDMEIFTLIDQTQDLKKRVFDAIFLKTKETFLFYKEKIKSKEYSIDFNDLIFLLKNSLENNQKLASAIRKKYPIAFIDEFQDTDQTQLSIFKNIYNTKKTSLIFVGDPKQAIYKFRGADIYAYLSAKKSVDKIFSLATNYRSSTNIIKALNKVYSLNKKPFLENGIDYQQITAFGKNKNLLLENKEQSAIDFFLLEDGDITNSKEIIAYKFAQIIFSLLTKNYILGKKKVSAQNIAIIVRTKSEANLLEKGLNQFNIKSVYSSRDLSVFKTNIARDVFYLLEAIVNYNNTNLLKKNCLNLFKYTNQQLEDLFSDEQKIEEEISCFKNYFNLWQNHGVFVMLTRVIAQKNLVKLLYDQDNELDYLIYLSEVLEKYNQIYKQPYELLELYNKKMMSQNDAQEDTIAINKNLDAISIVTIHKSKGLEYDIVLMPFFSFYKKDESCIYYQDHKLVYDQEKKHESDFNRLQEDMRLLYVALTRAVYKIYIAVLDKDDLATKSSVNFLLANNTKNLSLSSYLDDLSAANKELFSYKKIPQQIDFKYQIFQKKTKKEEQYFIKKFTKTINTNYKLNSFTSLLNILEKNSKQKQEIIENKKDKKNTQELLRVILDFKKGKETGLFFHEILEKTKVLKKELSENELEKQDKKIIKIFSKYNINLDFLEDIKKYFCILKEKKIKLNSDNSFSLSNLTTDNFQTELNFNMRLKENYFAIFLKIINQNPLKQSTENLKISGILTGIIDLIFVKDDKYYLLDYKTNYLGENFVDYETQKIKTNIKENYYDLQYYIYSLFLDFYLKKNLKNYSYENNFGGVIYLYLRGINSKNSSGIFFTKPSFDKISKLSKCLL